MTIERRTDMEINFIEVLINLILASLGGLVKRLSDMEKNKNQKVTFSYYLIGSCISMFVGIVVYFLCKNFNVSQSLTAGLTALSGYIGAPVLDLLSDIAKHKVSKMNGIQEDKDKK